MIDQTTGIIRVLGLDPAMDNIGWRISEVDLSAWPVEGVDPKTPNHQLFPKVEGGTFNMKKECPGSWLERMVLGARAVHQLVDEKQPDVISLEGALDKGKNRSTTGLALFALIVEPWLKQVPEHRHSPSFIISITPERVQSLAYGKRSTSGTEAKQIYREQTGDQESYRKYTEHETDAYYLAYYGMRFLLSTVLGPRDQHPWAECLSDKELWIFQEATKVVRGTTVNNSLLGKEGEVWWPVQL